MSSTRNQIYGPGRNADYESIKEFNWKGSVLQAGDYNLLNNSWDTHYRSVLKDLFSRDHSNVRNSQNFTKYKNAELENSHEFGREKGVWSYDQTSSDYGQYSWKCRPRKMRIDREIHIVDFSPKYNSGYDTDFSSMYRYSYNNANMKSSNRTNLGELQSRTKDVRTTHFDFGTCKDRISTETSDSFKDMAFEKCSTKKTNNDGQYQSNIFKDGDWNVAKQSLVKKSVTADEFVKSDSLENRENLTRIFGKSSPKTLKDQPDYIKTHLNIQEGKKEVPQYFRRDYLVGIGGAIQKPQIAKAPPSSSVIPIDGSAINASINKEDYISYRNELKTLDRSMDFFKNKIHLAENHIKQAQNNGKTSPTSRFTVTTSSYLKPASDALMLQHLKAPVSKYRHLESDAALTKPRDTPLLSEAKDSFRKDRHTANSQMTKDDLTKLNDVARKREGRMTHFVFGTDAQGRTTEHDTRFNQPSKMDPNVPAAGVKDQKTSAFAKMYEKSEGAKIEKIELSNEQRVTVMQDDYKPMNSREFTSSQQRLITKLEKHPPKIVPSHLFHLDSTSSLISRTKTDFTAPYKLKGNLAISYKPHQM